MTIDLGRLAILGSTNLDYLAMSFSEVAREYEIGLTTYVPPYGQAFQDLLQDASASKLYQFDPQAVLVAEQAEDLFGDLYWDPLAVPPDQQVQALEERLAPLIRLLLLARERIAGPIFVLRIAVLHRSTLGQADAVTTGGLGTLVAIANDLLAQQAAKLSDVHLVDMARVIAEVGSEAGMPRKYWHLGRIPFGNPLARQIAKRVLGGMLALSGKTARLLILDLDNTLWGGVLGEDGLQGLKLGGGSPGSAFKDFQRVLKALSRRGIALAVCSKNDADLAWKMIDEHPEMVLRRSDFIASRINWQNKAANVAEILAEVSLGAQSCCFIDDNPVERETVKRNVPGIFVPDFPLDPSEIVPWLLDYPLLECLALTASDLARSEHYRARAQANVAKLQVSDLTDFYRDLKMQVRFEPYGPRNQERIQQLLVKTNQFNTTTRRHDGAKLAKMLDSGSEIYALGMQDRLAPFELFGVMILEPTGDSLEIESFLMSCRILGRTLETAALAFAFLRMRELQKKELRAKIIKTERNTPVHGLYTTHGFTNLGDDVYSLSIERPIDMPDYFTVLK